MSREAFGGLMGPALERVLRGDYRAALIHRGWAAAVADAMIAELLVERAQGPVSIERVDAIKHRHLDRARRAAAAPPPRRTSP